jgi:hypothetical protein
VVCEPGANPGEFCRVRRAVHGGDDRQREPVVSEWQVDGNEIMLLPEGSLCFAKSHHGDVGTPAVAPLKRDLLRQLWVEGDSHLPLKCKALSATSEASSTGPPKIPGMAPSVIFFTQASISAAALGFDRSATAKSMPRCSRPARANLVGVLLGAKTMRLAE